MRRHLSARFGLPALREVLGRQRNQVVGLRHALREEEPQLVLPDRPAEHRVHVVGVVERVALADVRPQFVGDVVVLERSGSAEDAEDSGIRVAPFARNGVHAHAADGDFRRLRPGVVHQFLLRQLVDAHAVGLLSVLCEVLADVHAVEIDVLILAQRSVDRHVAGEALAVEADAGDEARAALHGARGRQHVERLAVDHRLVLRALQIDDRRSRGDHHRFFDLSDAQARVDGRRERALEHDAVALVALEARKRERHRIRARPKIDDRVTARPVGDAAAHALDQRRARRFDGDTRQHRARRILDDADDARPLLSERAHRARQRRGEHEDGRHRSTHEPS